MVLIPLVLEGGELREERGRPPLLVPLGLLGCKVEQEPGKVRLHQEKYCNDILKRFQHSECKPISTPCEPNMHLSDADCPRMEDRDPEVIRNYQALVGALMYLTCFTRGDCSFAVNQCARFMSNPGPSHIKAARRVLRYLAGTRSHTLIPEVGGMRASPPQAGCRSPIS